MIGNFVLLHRKLLSSEVFADERLLKVWIWCLCRASHKQQHVNLTTGRGNNVIKLQAGQFIFGRNTAAESLGMKASSLRDRMKRLQKLGNITLCATKTCTIVTVVNWSEYQKQPDNLNVDAPLAGTASSVDEKNLTRQPTDNLNPSEPDNPSAVVNGCGKSPCSTAQKPCRQAKSGEPTTYNNLDDINNQEARVRVAAIEILRVLGSIHASEILVWQVAYLVASEQIAPANATVAAEKVRQHSRRNPIGYFRTVLDGELGGQLGFMLGATIPNWVKPQSLPAGSTGFGTPQRAADSSIDIEDRRNEVLTELEEALAG